MNKIEEQELEKLKKFHASVYNMKIELADTEVSLSRLSNKKTALMFDLETAANELGTYQNELFSKYGDVKIDLKTGEYATDK